MTFSGRIDKIYFSAKVFILLPAVLWILLLPEYKAQIYQSIILTAAYFAINLILYWLSTKRWVKGLNTMFLLTPVDALFLYFLITQYGGINSMLYMPFYFLTVLLSIYLPARKVIVAILVFSTSYILSVMPQLNDDLIYTVIGRTFFIWLTAGIGYMIANNMQSSEKRLLKTLDTLNERTWELETSQLILENIYETTRAMSSMLNLETLLKEVLNIADGLLRVKKCAILLSESSGKNLCIYAKLVKGKKTLYDPPLSITDFKPVDIDYNNVKDDNSKSQVNFNMKSRMLELPLISHGKVIGLLQLEPLKKGEFSEKERKNFTVFANSTAIAIDNAKLHSKMQELTIVDELTGLYNYRHFRRKLADEIRRADRYQQKLAILMIDADHFKKLNDTQGHQTGNIILQEIAGIVKHSVRDVDIVARFGGEEFVVILPQTNLQNATVISERMRAQVENSYFSNSQGQRDLKATVSIGIAIYPDGYMSSNQLLEKVDKAMYMAKNQGRNRVCVAPSQEKESQGKLIQ